MKKSVYDIVTEKIIEGLKKGIIPWKRKWKGNRLPVNFFSKTHYRGINQLLLGINEFDSPYYLTFNQVNKLGGSIKKGSKSEMVVFWKIYKNTRKIKDEESGKEEKTSANNFVLRYYNIFNAEQIEGIEFPAIESFEHRPIVSGEKIWEGYKDRPNIIRGNPAYNPFSDLIKMPNRNQFETAESYYKTLFHEAIHSTGHKSRLDRNMLSGFGNREEYSFEELIAELGASYLLNNTGISWDEENSQAYINGWLAYLKKEKTRTLISASSKAKKAVRYILGEEDK